MSLTSVILIAGTNSWRPGVREWYMPGSPFVAFLQAQGIEPVFGQNGRPFTWSTDLGGVGFGDGDHRVWQAAGVNLIDYVVPPRCPNLRILPAYTNVIAHSHALQVVLYACADGLEVDTLVSVGSPVRADMEDTARWARPRIRRWIHLHSDRSDRWQWLGGLFDGRLGIVRRHPLADQNIAIPSVGHSTILRDPQAFHHWQDSGVIAALREITVV